MGGTPRDVAYGAEPVRGLDAVTGVGDAGPTRRRRPRRAPELGRRLRVLDLIAVAAAVLLAWTFDGDGVAIPARLLLGSVTVGATVFAIAAHGLYRARACAVRSVELVGLARARGDRRGWPPSSPVGASGSRSSRPRSAPASVTFLALAAVRGGFVAWLRRARTQGRYSRSIVVVGGAAEAERLVWLLRRHPELGLRPVGVVGEDARAGRGRRRPVARWHRHDREHARARRRQRRGDRIRRPRRRRPQRDGAGAARRRRARAALERALGHRPPPPAAGAARARAVRLRRAGDAAPRPAGRASGRST